MPRRPTLQDIADQAGVSRWTACQALKNHPRLAKKTKNKIQAIAKKLRYQPNAFASALIRSKTGNILEKGTIACIIGHDKFNPLSKDLAKNYPFLAYRYGRTFSGAKKRAQQAGYQLDTFWAYDLAHKGKRLDRILQARGIHGILLFHIHESELQLDWSKYSCAYTSLHSSMSGKKHIHFSFSAVNYYQITFSAISNLLTRGYKKIGLFMWRQYEEQEDFCFSSAYYGALKSAQIPKSLYIPTYYWDTILNQKDFLKWFNRYQPEVLVTPGGIVSAESYLSALPLKFLEPLGLRVPVEAQLIHLCLDSFLIKKRVTGFSIPYDSLAAAGIDLVVNQLQNNEYGLKKTTEIKSVYLQPEWIEGKTLLRK